MTVDEMLREIGELLQKIKNGDVTEFCFIAVDGSRARSIGMVGPTLIGAMIVEQTRFVNKVLADEDAS